MSLVTTTTAVWVGNGTGGLGVRVLRLLASSGTEFAGHVFNAIEGGSNTRKPDLTGTVDGRYGNQWLQVPAEDVPLLQDGGVRPVLCFAGARP